MRRARLLPLAALAATCALGMKMNQGTESALARSRTTCGPDDLSFARITTSTCKINWALADRNSSEWAETQQVGCWKLLEYNTDKFFSSAIYRNQEDGRCTLAFSGYHGSLAGYLRGVLSLNAPPTTWPTCGYQMWAPYVRLMRHHTSLSNWTKIMHLLGSSESQCRGDHTLVAESMGGSTGEMLAACANAGKLEELMPEGMPAAGLPRFRIQTLYTFGSPGASTVPIRNVLREDGCFKGKRIYLQGDLIAHFGSTWNLVHPRMDAVEIWPPESKAPLQRPENPSIASYRCNSSQAVGDHTNARPAPLKGVEMFSGPNDLLQHSVTTYEADMEWLHRSGMDGLFAAEPYASQTSLTAEKYASIIRAL